jgi:hypothetical protein
MLDPNFAAPVRGGTGANAGIGAQGAPGLPRQEDDFNAAQMAGLLGLMQKAKKPGEDAASAAPGAASLDAAQPGMTPITNEGNFDWAPAMPQVNPDMKLPNGGNFAMPQAGSGEAFQLGNVGGAAPLMSNFGAGIPAGGPQAVAEMGSMAMPASIGGAGIPQLAGMDPAQLQNLTLPWLQGGFGGAGAM